MQTPPVATNEQNELIARFISGAITVFVIVAPVVARYFPKLKIGKTDTGETRKTAALANVIGDLQNNINALEKANAELIIQNANLKADNEALTIRINNLETDLRILQKVVEVLSNPKATPAGNPPAPPITGEDEKGTS